MLGFKYFQREWTPIIEKHLDLQPSKVLTFLNIDVESYRGLDGYYREYLVPPSPILHVSVQSIYCSDGTFTTWQDCTEYTFTLKLSVKRPLLHVEY